MIDILQSIQDRISLLTKRIDYRTATKAEGVSDLEDELDWLKKTLDRLSEILG